MLKSTQMESGLIFPLLRGGVISLGDSVFENQLSSENGVRFGSQATATSFVQMSFRYAGKSDATGTGYIAVGEQDRSVDPKTFTRRGYLLIPLTDAGYYSVSFVVSEGMYPAWKFEEGKSFGNILTYMTTTPLTIVSN